MGGWSSCSNFSASQRRRSAPSRVTCCAPTSSSRKTHDGFVMKKEANGASTVVDESPITGGGVWNVYGEDKATEDQGVTPWSVSVSSMVSPSEEKKRTQHTSPEMEAEYCEEYSVLGPELSSVDKSC